MKYLLGFDLVMAALGAAMTVAVGYVALTFAVYSGDVRMRTGLPSVATITACFAVLRLPGRIPGWGLWKRRGWHWIGQGLLVVSLPLLFAVVYRNVGGR